MESETAGTVCRGYALAYRLLLNRLGIPCLAVGNREHVWNLIRLGDGNWYHVDVNAANNIVPTLRGRCRHSFFLLSDETLQALGQADGERVNSAYASWYAYSWQDGIESLWATEAPACMSKQFETGWAFCGRVDFPMYATERGYYAVRRVDAKECALYKYPAKGTALAGQGELLAALPLYTYAEDGRYYTRSGVVWQKDFLYYVNMEKELICHDLLTQEEISLGTVPFFAMPSYDRNYTRLNDGIGLYYDKEQQEIVAVSRSRRRELARFAAVFH